MLSLFVTGNKNTAIVPHQADLFGLKLKVCPELELAFVFVFIFHFVLFLFRELDIVATVVVILQEVCECLHASQLFKENLPYVSLSKAVESSFSCCFGQFHKKEKSFLKKVKQCDYLNFLCKSEKMSPS